MPTATAAEALDLLSGEIDSETNRDRREHERRDFHTVATLLCGRPGAYRPLKSWSTNISLSGAQIVCTEKLEDEEVFLQLLMPGLAGKYIRAEVRNERESQEDRLGRRLAPRYVYGLRFAGFVADAGQIQALDRASRVTGESV